MTLSGRSGHTAILAVVFLATQCAQAQYGAPAARPQKVWTTTPFPDEVSPGNNDVYQYQQPSYQLQPQPSYQPQPQPQPSYQPQPQARPPPPQVAGAGNAPTGGGNYWWASGARPFSPQASGPVAPPPAAVSPGNPFLSGARPQAPPPQSAPQGCGGGGYGGGCGAGAPQTPAYDIPCNQPGQVCVGIGQCNGGYVAPGANGIRQGQCSSATQTCCRQQPQQPSVGGYGGAPAPRPQQPQPTYNNYPQQPQPRPAPQPQPQLPRPQPQQPSYGGGYSQPQPNYGGQAYNPQPTPGPYTGPLNTTPYPGCAAALKCVEELYCDAKGVMRESPQYLTREEQGNRVAMSECQNPETGIIGKCCRDPNYKDPWPGGMMMKNMPTGPGAPAPPPPRNGGQGAPAPQDTCANAGGVCVQSFQCPAQSRIQPEQGCNLAVGAAGGPGVCCEEAQPYLEGQDEKPEQPESPADQSAKPSFSNEASIYYNQPKTPASKPVPAPTPAPQVSGNGYPAPPQTPAYRPQNQGIPQPYSPQPTPQTTPQPQPAPQPLPQPARPAYSPQPFYPQPAPKPFIPQQVYQSAPAPYSPQPAPQPAPVPYSPQPAPQPQPIPTPYSPQPAPQPAPAPYSPQPAPQPQPTPTPYSPQPAPQSAPAPYTPQPAPQPQPAPAPYSPQPAPTPYSPEPAPQPTSTTYGLPPSTRPSYGPQSAPQSQSSPQPAPQTFPAQTITSYSQPTQPSPVPYSPEPAQPAPGPAPQPGVVCGVRRPAQKLPGAPEEEAAPGEFPWHALVMSRSNQTAICGAAVLSQDAVITAAHCVQGFEASDLMVKAGSHGMGMPEVGAQQSGVAAIARHPKFEPASLFHDQAVLRLSEPFTLNDKVDTICLPESGSNPQPGEQCVATGWGLKNVKGNHVGSNLNGVPSQVLSTDDTERHLQRTFLGPYFKLHNSFTCAKATKPNTNLCMVDPGGPLACPRPDGSYAVAGVYSWDVGCHPANVAAPEGLQAPTAFAGMDAEWVKSVMNTPVQNLVQAEKNDVLRKQQQEKQPAFEKPGFDQGYGK